jgi:hypothetical protein
MDFNQLNFITNKSNDIQGWVLKRKGDTPNILGISHYMGRSVACSS